YYNSTYGTDAVAPLVREAWFITAPELTYPAINVWNCEVRPRFAWTAIPGVTSYTLHIFNGSNDDRTLNLIGANVNAYTPTTDLNYGQRYTWTVYATGSGLTSPISQRILTTRPVLTASISGPSCVDDG